MRGPFKGMLTKRILNDGLDGPMLRLCILQKRFQQHRAGYGIWSAILRGKAPQNEVLKWEALLLFMMIREEGRATIQIEEESELKQAAEAFKPSRGSGMEEDFQIQRIDLTHEQCRDMPHVDGRGQCKNQSIVALLLLV